MKYINKFLLLVCSIMVFSVPVYAEEIVDTGNHIYSYDEMMIDIAELNEQYPGTFEVKNIGTTTDGRIIPEIILGDKNSEHAIFVISSIHGREWMNSWMLMKCFEDMLINYNMPYPPMGDTTYGDMYQECAVYLLPMVNPDGVTISQYGINGIVHENIRANLANMKGINNPTKWKANANGVDLNRNFDIGFGINIPPAYYRAVPCSEYFNGPFPYSETETAAIKTAFDERYFDLAVSYHSFEGAIYWDLGQPEPMRSLSLYYAGIAKNVTGYRYGELSLIHGLDYNYFLYGGNTPALCIETGKVPCPLPYSQFAKLYKQNRDVMDAFIIDITSRSQYTR